MSSPLRTSERLWAALSYLWVLSIFVFLVHKDDFVQQHARQGMLLFIGECIILLPLIGLIVGWMISLAAVFLAVVGVFHAIVGKTWFVPVVGRWWDKKLSAPAVRQQPR